MGLERFHMGSMSNKFQKTHMIQGGNETTHLSEGDKDEKQRERERERLIWNFAIEGGLLVFLEVTCNFHGMMIRD